MTHLSLALLTATLPVIYSPAHPTSRWLPRPSVRVVLTRRSVFSIQFVSVSALVSSALHRRYGPVAYCRGKDACERLLRSRAPELGIELTILQPGSIFGPWGEGGWCKLFAKAEADPKIVGVPGSSTFVDARDLAGAFIAAVDAGAGAGEAYLIGGTNATNMELQAEVAGLVGVPPPARVLPPRLLMLLAAWNEALLWLPPRALLPFHWLRFKPDVIGHPWLMRKLTQDQTSECKRAQAVLGLKPRPLREMLEENYRHLIDAGICHGPTAAAAAAAAAAGSASGRGGGKGFLWLLAGLVAALGAVAAWQAQQG